MEQYWREEELGLAFYGMPVESCQQERIEMLYFEGSAEEREHGYFLSYENVARLSEADAELFALPERNPYQISITADGTIGFNDLHYTFSVLKPGGGSFVNPKIHGCILHIDEETTYRLDIHQYNLVRVVNESNQTVPNMDKKDLAGYSLINLAHIQNHARATAARLDDVISPENQRVVVPEKLDVEFVNDGDGIVHVNPVILGEEKGLPLGEGDEKTFQTLFDKKGVRNVYSSEKDGKRIKYVCNPEVKSGLEKVKKVNSEKMSLKEAERYIKQPKELFDEDIFEFRGSKNNTEKANDEKLWETLPGEGEFIPAEYSDRVTGIAPIKKAVYYGSGHKTEWLVAEGATEFEYGSFPEDNKDELKKEQPVESQSNDCFSNDDEDTFDLSNSVGFKKDAKDIESDLYIHEHSSPQALDIKPNFDIAEYSRDMMPRNGKLNPEALKEGITLYDYQKEAVTWMYNAWSKGYTGVLLADDMGLGKTLQTLAFLAELKSGTVDEVSKPILIVGPTALLKNWENEYNRFVRDGVFKGIVPLHGSAIRKFQTGDVAPNGKKKLELRLPNNVIALTTYETLRDYQFSFAEIAWGTIIVDEAQKIKNPTTGVTTAIKAMNYDYAICLSGTPVENSWIDIWSIMDFVHPDYLGSLQEFRENYVNKLKGLDGDVNGIERLGRQLKKNLNPLFMRRMKKDKLEGIPKKTVHVCAREMPLYQKKRYFSILKEAEDENIHPLMIIAKLRDVSLHPDIGIKSLAAFYEMNPEEVINQSARLMVTFEVLRDIKRRDEKALVFVVSKKMQMVLRHLLASVFGIAVYSPVNGDMNGMARQRIIDKFNKDVGFGVLILSPEAAGVGFTITSANHVIHLSRTWNPAKEDQATDRVYRIGQKKEVHVYIPMASTGEEWKSFDENLNELLEYKRQLSDNVLFPTSDDFRDGQKIFNKCVNENGRYDTNFIDVVTIEKTDEVIGDVFEEIITNLYGSMDGYKAEKTPHSNDNGADVVVLCDDGKNGILIQCKHRDDPFNPIGKQGVQEVFAAVNYYKNTDDYRGIDFETAVVTNAVDYTSGAKELAKNNGVSLIARNELSKMLNDVHLPNIY